MRVLVCTTEYPPEGSGIAYVVYNIVQELEAMGVECTVCSPIGPDIKLGSWTLIQKAGIIGLLNYWHQASKHFEENDFDVVWLQNPLLITSRSFKRCIVTIHGTYYGSLTYAAEKYSLYLYRLLAARVERYCLTRMPPNARFTGVGKSVCEELEKIGIERDRIIYIPNGVDTEQFRPSPDKRLLRKKFGIPEDDIVLLSVGRLTLQKQPYTMIEVFSHLEKELGDVTLCIAGKGELSKETKDLAEKMGLRKVLFMGYVDDKDLPDLYACSDYYIMTSKYEGGEPPLTLAEAMASGLPCIVSDIPNLRIVRDADCGIVLDFSNIKSASDQILDYVRAGRSRHSQNARKYATNQLDWHPISEQYLQKFLEKVKCNVESPSNQRSGL